MEKHININKIVPICLALCLLVLCALFSGCTPGGSEVTTSPDKETSPETTLGISPETTSAETDEDTSNAPDTTVIPEIYESRVFVYDYLGDSVVHILKPGETLPKDALDFNGDSPEEGVLAEIKGYEYSISKDGERRSYDPANPPVATPDGMHIYPVIEYKYRIVFEAGEGRFAYGSKIEFYVRAGSVVKVSELLTEMPEKAEDNDYEYPLLGFMLDGNQISTDETVKASSPMSLTAVYGKEEIIYNVRISTEFGELIGGGQELTLSCNYRDAEKIIESYNSYSSEDIYLHDALHEYSGITVSKTGREWKVVLNWKHVDIRYTVTFDYGDGQEAVLSHISADGKAILPTPERREDKERYYDFVGWRDKNGQLFEGGSEITVSESITFSAEFVPSDYKVYTVVFKTAVGVFSDRSTSVVVMGHYGDDLTPPRAPDASYLKVGEVVFEFAGWDAEVPHEFTEDRVFNAVYTTAQPVYYLNFYIDDELYLSVPHYASTPLVNPERPESTKGMIFSGWSDLPEKMPEHDVELYASARFPEILYMLDGEIYSHSEAKAGVLVTLAAPAEKPGHTVSGWSTADIESLQNGGFVMPEKDIVFTATSVPKPHTVKYLISGVLFYTDNVFFGEVYTVRGIEVRTGYNFSGWKLQNTGVDAASGILSVPDEDLVFVGEFERCSYNVNYYLEDEIIYVDTYYYGDTVTLRPHEEQEGCTFAWHSAGANITSGRFNMPAGDVDIYGIFSDGDNKVIFVIDGNEYGSIGFSAGEEVYVAFTPTKLGYTFSGWNCDDIDVSSGEFIMPEGNIILRGSFIPNAHDIFFVDIATGVVINTSHLDYGSSFSLGDRIFCDAGRISEGWVLIAGHAVSNGDEYIMPDSDVIFGLIWEDCLTLEIDEDYHIPYYALLYDEFGGCRYDEATKTVYISEPSIKAAGESEGITVVYEYIAE